MIYIGHYQRYGLNVQACCDHQSRFIALGVNSPGGRNDAVAHLEWDLKNRIDGLPECVYVAGNLISHVGDNAYINGPHLITPFAKPDMTVDRKHFCFYISQLRIRIEMAFALLVTKWRIFKKPMEVKLRKVLYLLISRLKK
jgi:hypothetical protein